MTYPDDQYLTPDRPSPLAGVTWDWRDLIVGIVVVAVSFLALSSAIIGLSWALYGEDSVEALGAEAASVVMLDFVLIAVVLWVIGRKGAGWHALGFRSPKGTLGIARRSPWLDLVVAAFIASFVFRIIVVVFVLGAEAIGADELLPEAQLSSEYFDHTFVIAIIGIGVVFGAPVAEELFFRGFLFGGLRRYFGFPVAAAISGLLFSVVHFQIGLFLPYAVLGILLAYMYERSGSLFAPITAHFFFNGLSFLILLAVPEAR
jgi:membrane protease YdiL (CAAX protease family)